MICTEKSSSKYSRSFLLLCCPLIVIKTKQIRNINSRLPTTWKYISPFKLKKARNTAVYQVRRVPMTSICTNQNTKSQNDDLVTRETNIMYRQFCMRSKFMQLMTHIHIRIVQQRLATRTSTSTLKISKSVPAVDEQKRGETGFAAKSSRSYLIV